MYGEIDLEVYTISITKLNTAFRNLENLDSLEDTKKLIDESTDNLEKLYEDFLNDMHRNMMNSGEYQHFFEYGLLVFPKYIENLKTIENRELANHINRLINVFDDLNKLAIAFCNIEVI